MNITLDASLTSLAQEESRKTSERVKWGIRRKMEQGFVYGKSHMLGYNIIDGKLEVIPEEAEIIKKIFHMYVFEGKGSGRIANTLNAAGYTSSTGAIFRRDSIMTILKNEKYCGECGSAFGITGSKENKNRSSI